eukprot:18702-Heterococcus_DN1.PRE.5
MSPHLANSDTQTVFGYNSWRCICQDTVSCNSLFPAHTVLQHLQICSYTLRNRERSSTTVTAPRWVLDSAMQNKTLMLTSKACLCTLSKC